MSTATRRDRLVELLEPVVAAAGFDLEDVNVTPAGKRRVLKLVVDRDAGVSLDDTSELSQAVSRVLDSSDAMGSGPYTLEVTSPGVERPLREERHWRRAVGRLVRVSHRDGEQLTGRVVSADEGGVALDVDGARWSFGYDELGRGKVQVEFGQASQPSEGTQGKQGKQGKQGNGATGGERAERGG